MIPRFRPPLKWKQIFRILGSGEPSLQDWEARLARAAGYTQAVWFPYGRVAAQAFFECQKATPSAVLSAFNCSALLAGLLSANAKVHFVDTEPEGFNQDPDLFLSALRVSRKRTGVVVHQWGIDPRLSLDSTPNPLLHDKALCDFQSPVHNLKPSDAVLHSFGWGKPLASLHGAALFSNDEATAAKWRTWRAARLLPPAPSRELLECFALKVAFQPILFGGVYRLAAWLPLARQLTGNTTGGGIALPTNWNRRVSEGVFRMLMDHIEAQEANRSRRIEMSQSYTTQLQALAPYVKLPPVHTALSHYPIRVRDRDALHAHLLRRGYFTSTRLFANLLCDLVPSNSVKKDFPNARRLTAETLHLPLYPSLGRTEQTHIAAAISGWCHLQRKDESCYSITTDVNSSTIPS
ncbi:MAG: DegT/DnrJ/EryC1/StrS family aminotransferase [Bdellovibrionales bacterium]|nr:DegT/DnrJ/EryC1/StrS family aminotransferase [Bdellovibrionales bacterium]